MLSNKGVRTMVCVSGEATIVKRAKQRHVRVEIEQSSDIRHESEIEIERPRRYHYAIMVEG
jgi:hypothetical protein